MKEVRTADEISRRSLSYLRWEDDLDENKALYDTVRRQRKDLVEQIVRSQHTMDEARELIKQLDLMLAKLQPSYQA